MRVCYYKDASTASCRLGLPLRCSGCRSFRRAATNITPPTAIDTSSMPKQSPEYASGASPQTPEEKTVLKSAVVSGGCGCKKGNK